MVGALLALIAGFCTRFGTLFAIFAFRIMSDDGPDRRDRRTVVNGRLCHSHGRLSEGQHDDRRWSRHWCSGGFHGCRQRRGRWRRNGRRSRWRYRRDDRNWLRYHGDRCRFGFDCWRNRCDRFGGFPQHALADGGSWRPFDAFGVGHIRILEVAENKSRFRGSPKRTHVRGSSNLRHFDTCRLRTGRLSNAGSANGPSVAPREKKRESHAILTYRIQTVRTGFAHSHRNVEGNRSCSCCVANATGV